MENRKHPNSTTALNNSNERNRECVSPLRLLYPRSLGVPWDHGYSLYKKIAIILWRVISSTSWMDNRRTKIQMVHEKPN